MLTIRSIIPFNSRKAVLFTLCAGREGCDLKWNGYKFLGRVGEASDFRERGGGSKLMSLLSLKIFFFCSIRPTVWIFLFLFEILDQGIYCWFFFFKLCLSDFVYLSDGTTKIEDSG